MFTRWSQARGRSIVCAEIRDLGELARGASEVRFHGSSGLYLARGRIGARERPDRRRHVPDARSCATRCRSGSRIPSSMRSRTAGGSSRSARWRRRASRRSGTGPRGAPDRGVRCRRDPPQRRRLPRRRASSWPCGSCRGSGSSAATVPQGFPLGIADALRAAGVELDRRPEALRRPPAAQERARARGDQARAEGGRGRRRGRARACSRAPSARTAGSSVDGEPLTCELLKERDPDDVPRPRRARRGDDRLARPADRRRPRHGLRADRPRTTSSCSISSRSTSSRRASRT